ncbi:MAG TPA: 50S ribosomal protein L25/general stress protein Ctc [Burkholderiaceae bacterium]|nr:50S ribosomal protein L25/general stress protein Ctc [Burkholderiaceae bacterium]
MKVEAVSRTQQGTGASRRLRRASKVPGIVYGGSDKPVNIELDHNTMFHAMRKEAFHSSVLDLEIDGKPAGQVLLRDYQVHPFKPIVMHLDFQRVSANEKLHKKVPLHFTGQENSPAVKLAHNIVSHVMTEIDIRCLPKDLPEFIEVDLSGLEATGTVHASHLKLPAGVELVVHTGEDPVVATATAPRVSKADEDADAATAAAASAASAAAAPAPAGKK